MNLRPSGKSPRRFGGWLLLLIAALALPAEPALAQGASVTVGLKSLAPADTFVTEGEPLVFTVIGIARSSDAISVQVKLRIDAPDGYASADEITVSLSAEENPGAGINGANDEVRIPTRNDALDRPDGQVTITVLPGSGYVLTEDANVKTFTVRDDERSPGPVQSLSAEPGYGAVTLSWSAPATSGQVDGQDAAVTGYEVRHALGNTIPDSTAWAAVPDGGTSHQITDLSAGDDHRFEVRAMVGDSIAGEVAAITAAPLLKPTVTVTPPHVLPTEGESIRLLFQKYLAEGRDAPLDVSISITDPDGRLAPSTPTVITLDEWSAPNRRLVVDQFVEFSTVNDSLFNRDAKIAFRIVPGASYRHQLNPVSVTLGDDDTLPGAPADLTASPGEPRVVTLSWKAPADPGKVNGKAPTVGYEVRRALSSSNVKQASWVAVAAGAVTHEFSGMAPHQTYNFEVRARTAAGVSAPAPVSAVPNSRAPTVTLSPIAATIGAGESLSLRATGADPDADTLSYAWTTEPADLGAFGDSGATPTWTAPRVRVPTEVTIQVEASDGTQQARASRTITVNPAVVQVSVGSGGTSGAEGDAGTHSIEFSLGYAASGVSFSAATAVDVSVTAPDVDLVSPPTSVTIPAGQSSTTFSVEYRGNVTDNPDRTVTVALQAGDWYAPSSTRSTVTYTINDDDDHPASPGGLTAAAGYRQVTLSWTAPTQTGLLNGVAAEVTGYEYRVAATTEALASAAWTAIADSASATSHIVSALALETDYAFDLRALTSVGPGPASDAVTATTRGLPKISVASASASTSVTEGGVIEFRLNVTTGALDRDGQRAGGLPDRRPGRSRRRSRPTRRQSTRSPAETSSHRPCAGDARQANNLVDGDSPVVVTLRSGAGYTVDSDAPSVQFTVEDDDDRPAAPTALTGDAGYRQATLSWTPPADTGQLNGTAIALTGYEYRLSEDATKLAAASWQSIPDSASATSHTVTGLDMNQAYSFQLRVRNSLGYSPPSNVHSLTTLTGLTVSISVDAPTSAVEGTLFNVRLRANPGAPDADLEVNIELVDAGGRVLETGPLTATITGGSREVVRAIRSNNDGMVNTEDEVTLRLLPGTGYAVDATNDEVELTVTDNESAPGAPASLTLEPGYNRIHLDWSAPTNTGTLNSAATPVTGYEYRIAPTDESIDDAAWRVVAGGAATTSGFSTGLDQGTPYAIELRARNAAAPGPAVSLSATTGTLVLSITQAGSTTVTEGQPSIPSTNSKRPTYSIEANLELEEDLTVNLSVTDPDGLVTGRIGTTATVAKGEKSATWEFLTNQNQAVNTAEKVEIALAPGDGYGVHQTSNSVEFTITDDDAAPGPVVGLAVSSTVDSLTYTWQPASAGRRDNEAAPVVRYEVRHTAGGGELESQTWTTVDGGGGARSFALTGLSDNQDVDLQIRAVNSVGSGPVTTIDAQSELNTAPTVTVSRPQIVRHGRR